jgi:LPXTG-motif cell wall-anchored protein
VQTFGNIALEREKTNQVVTILGVIAGIGLLGFLLLTLTRKK